MKVVAVVLVVAVILAVLLVILRKREGFCCTSCRDQSTPVIPPAVDYTLPPGGADGMCEGENASINAYNHLNKDIVLESTEDNRAFEIGAGDKVSIGKAQQFFTKGAKILVHTICDIGKELKFNEYAYVADGLIREFHVGMVTSRYRAGDSGQDLQKAQAGNVDGMPYVYIHNNTDQPLRLNYNIIIAPHDSLRYRGEYAYGVALGTRLKDQSGVFKDFRILSPMTDIYYGINSDLLQAKAGGLTYSPKGVFNDADNNPGLSLFEDGWY